jgi:hypothetical protein
MTKQMGHKICFRLARFGGTRASTSQEILWFYAEYTDCCDPAKLQYLESKRKMYTGLKRAAVDLARLY